MLKKFLRLEELYEKIEKLQDNILILRREYEEKIKELEARIEKQDEFLRSVKGVIKNERKVSDYHKKLEWLRGYPDETKEN